jgi:hypothetical protein
VNYKFNIFSPLVVWGFELRALHLLYHLSHTSSLFCLGYQIDCHVHALALLYFESPFYTSCLAGMAGVFHHAMPSFHWLRSSLFVQAGLDSPSSHLCLSNREITCMGHHTGLNYFKTRKRKNETKKRNSYICISEIPNRKSNQESLSKIPLFAHPFMCVYICIYMYIYTHIIYI